MQDSPRLIPWSLGLSVLFLTLQLQGAPAEGQYRYEINETDAFRYLTISVPQLPADPKIDGKVDPEEWKHAAMGPRFHIVSKSDAEVDRLTDEMARTWFGYTAKGFYLAWQIERPADCRKPLSLQTVRDGRHWRVDDALEFHLNAVKENKGKRDYYFIWNAAGNQFDRREYPDFDPKWDPEWFIKSNADFELGWEGEVLIPFSILDRVEFPTEGDLWHFLLVSNRTSPYPRYESLCWPFPDRGRDWGHFLMAGKNGVFTHIKDCGQLSGKDRVGGLQIDIVNPGDSAQKVLFNCTLYKRKKDTASKKTYLAQFEESRDKPEDKAMGRVQLLTSDDKLAASILKENFDVVQEIKEEMNLAAHQTLSREVLSPSDPTEYVIIYDVRYADSKKIISGGPLQFFIPKTMDISLRKFFLETRKIECTVDLQYVPGFKEAGSLEVTLTGPGGRVFQKKWEGLSNATRFQKCEIPIENCKPGAHSLQVITRDKDGKTCVEENLPVNIPAPPEWFTKKVGMESFIPEPWKPITLNENKFSMLMGSYLIQNGPFPDKTFVRSQEETQEKELTRGAVTLEGQVNGRKISWILDFLKTVEKTDDHVTLQTQAHAGDLDLTCTTTVEYDGFLRFDLALASKDAQKPVAIDYLYLNIPMREEFARLYVRSKPIQPTPEFLIAGEVPKEGLKHYWTMYSWIGNEERGLCWFAENLKGWKVDPKFLAEAIELAPVTDGVDLRAHLIKVEKPLALAKKRDITFGLMFTPPRPKTLRQIHKCYATEIILGSGPDEQYAAEAKALVEKARLNAFCIWDQFGAYWKGWPLLTDPKQIAQQARRTDLIHAAGGKVLPYAGWYLPRNAPIYPDYGTEMAVDPLIDAGCGCDGSCWNTPYVDIFAALFKDRIADCKIDGFRMDGGFGPTKCASLNHHGHGSQCGWIDDDGNLQSSYCLFAARKGAMRLYRMFHGIYHKDGLCIQHAGGGVDPLWSHSDAFLNCEGPETVVKTLRELPLGYYRAQVMGEQHGMWVVYLAKANHLGLNSLYGIGLIHNVIPRAIGALLSNQWSISTSTYSRSGTAGTLVNIWKSHEWIENHKPGCKLLGYWKNKDIVKSSAPGIETTLVYREGKKLLVAALNLDTKPAQAELTLDLKKLGFTGAKLHVQDIIEPWLPVALENGVLKLAFLPEGYRYIAISTEPYPEACPQPVGSNLITEAKCAAWDLKKLPNKGAASVDVTKTTEGIQLIGKEKGGSRIAFKMETVPGKSYRAMASVRIDAKNKPYCGQPRDGLRLTIRQDKTLSNTLGSEVPANEWWPLAVSFTAKTDKTGLELSLSGEATADIKNISFYEVK